MTTPTSPGRTFDARIEPPIIHLAVKCETCKLTNAATAPSKAAYSHADVLDLLVLAAKLSAKPCGCAP